MYSSTPPSGSDLQNAESIEVKIFRLNSFFTDLFPIFRPLLVTVSTNNNNMKVASLLVALTAAADPKGTCGSKPTPADCENVDWGTCGTACCKYEYIMPVTSAELVKTIETKLKSGSLFGQ
jgi:hypothetical protein